MAAGPAFSHLASPALAWTLCKSHAVMTDLAMTSHGSFTHTSQGLCDTCNRCHEALFSQPRTSLDKT